VRKVDASGNVSTLAGGWGTFDYPFDVAVAPDGQSIYVADRDGERIRVISSADGTVSIFAGPLEASYYGSDDGPVTSARFSFPTGLAVSSDGSTVYVCDCTSSVIRKIKDGQVSTLAGLAGSYGSADGRGSEARFNFPHGLALGPDDATIYVADTWNSVIRRVSADGQVTTIAGMAGVESYADGLGSAARFYRPVSLAVDARGIFVADTNNHVIRAISFDGNVTTLAGRAHQNKFDDGPGSAARFAYPTGLAIAPSDGSLYVVAGILRKITM
jgi:DNA-binding beta-propeller fold protein YncE